MSRDTADCLSIVAPAVPVPSGMSCPVLSTVTALVDGGTPAAATQREQRVVSVRRVAGRVFPTVLWRCLRRPWVIGERQPRRPIQLDSFAFHAVIGTWMEADIIEATVANAFAHGVDRVFLIDNGSPDDTVDRATGAGAEHVLTFRTDHYDEERRVALMTQFAERSARESGARHVWWLWLDADEFPRPQSGGTLRSMLEALDRRFRIVGARFLNHYPSPGRAIYVPGRHPIDYQPLCEELNSTMCWEGHRKHPLIRWDRGAPSIAPTLGFHTARSATRPLSEPLEPIVIHHFPFRSEAAARARLEALFGRGDDATPRVRKDDVPASHMKARLGSLDAVYAGDWKNVESLVMEQYTVGVSPRDWRDLKPAISTEIPRWYSLEVRVCGG